VWLGDENTILKIYDRLIASVKKGGIFKSYDCLIFAANRSAAAEFVRKDNANLMEEGLQ
jgi:hypothetical protein